MILELYMSEIRLSQENKRHYSLYIVYIFVKKIHLKYIPTALDLNIYDTVL